jgi:UDP-glucose 4-epimerase
LLARHHAGVFDVTVLRLSAVYGPRVKGNYQRLLQMLATGRFVPVGAGENRRSLIHEDDAAMALATAAVHPAAPGGIFNVSDGSPHQLREIIAAMCLALGRAEPRLAIPAGPAIAAATLAEWACGLAGRRPPRAAAMLAKYREASVVDASRIAEQLGFAATVDLMSGWQRTVRELRAAGALPPTGGR